MRRRALPAAALLAALVSLSARAQSPEPPRTPAAELRPLAIHARVEPPRVRLGEPFTLELEVAHAPEQRYEWVAPSSMPEALELLRVARSRSDGAAGGPSVTTFRIELAAFSLGRLELPAFPLEVYAPGHQARQTAPSAEVEVVSALPDDAEEQGAELRDIRPPVAVPVPSYRLLWALLVLLGLGLLGYLGYLAAKAHRARRLARVVPLLPVDQRALAALDALRREELPSRGRSREFHFRLSEILRAYLGERYAFEALECTSPELLVALARLEAPELPLEEVRGFVQDSDLVKFARQEVSAARCQTALEWGYALVERTRPTPLPPKADAARVS